MLLYPLTNFEIQKYHQNELKFNGAYSSKYSPKIQNGVYVINIDKFKLIWTYWIAFYLNDNSESTSYDGIYFGSFRIEHIQKKKKKEKIKKNSQENKNIIKKIFIEYKHTSQQCEDTLVLDLLILY